MSSEREFFDSDTSPKASKNDGFGEIRGIKRLEPVPLRPGGLDPCPEGVGVFPGAVRVASGWVAGNCYEFPGGVDTMVMVMPLIVGLARL